MTQEEKELLIKDLCARLPYGVFVKEGDVNDRVIYTYDYHPHIETCKPYLRPMSSMTEEEEKECIDISRTIIIPHVRNWFGFSITNPFFTDWLNSHNFDYRNLIEKGLALEAKDGMYK